MRFIAIIAAALTATTVAAQSCGTMYHDMAGELKFMDIYSKRCYKMSNFNFVALDAKSFCECTWYPGYVTLVFRA